MVIGTHGRGVWAMDVSYIQKCDEKFLAETAHLFKVSPAKLPRWRGWGGIDGYIYYYLNKSQKVSLGVTDESGKLVRKLKGTGDAGLNRVVWDLRTDDKKYAKPGLYTVKLAVGAVELEEKVKVIKPERPF
jgi:hypothetical protein